MMNDGENYIEDLPIELLEKILILSGPIEKIWPKVSRVGILLDHHYAF